MKIATSYKVVCDETNNSEKDKEERRLNVDLFIKFEDDGKCHCETPTDVFNCVCGRCFNPIEDEND